MNKLFIIGLLCLFSTIGLPQTTLPTELVDKIDAFVAERMTQGKLPGLSLTIVKDG
jgi:CubicO group peptidase (beta-lactamase class C family)